MAAALLSSVGLDGNNIVLRLKGSELVGIPYQPLYNPHRYGMDRLRFKKAGSSELELQPVDNNLTNLVINTDFVSMEDGTGIVHVAPAFGEVDFEAGMQRGLDFRAAGGFTGKIQEITAFPQIRKKRRSLVNKRAPVSGALFKSTKIRLPIRSCWPLRHPASLLC
jgi:isoleucyl-tRNA synthetase